MKLKIYAYVLIAFIIFQGCSKESERNLLYLDYKNDRVLIDDKIVDESEITVYDKVNGLRLFFDCGQNKLWSTQQITNNHFQFNLVYPQDGSMKTYEKVFSDDEYAFSYAAIQSICDYVVLIRTHTGYLLYDILNDKTKDIECNAYYFLGFNGINMYFTTGYYSIGARKFIPYPDKTELTFKSKYFATDDIILSYESDNRIFIFYPKDGKRESLNLYANLSNVRNGDSIYYYSNSKLYYSKRKIVPKDFLLLLIPVPGYYYASNWHEYDMITKTTRRINVPSDYTAIIGILK